MEAADPLQRRLDSLLAAPAGPEDPLAFSPFVGDGGARAADLAAELAGAAEAGGLEAALDAAEQAAATQPAGLVKLALKLFVTHEPEAAGRLALPSVEALETQRAPR